jgi:hypothetical protein
MINLSQINRNLKIGRTEREMYGQLFKCVVCGTDTNLSIANKFNYYLNAASEHVDFSDSSPYFKVLTWDMVGEKYSLQFLVCGLDCRKKFLKILPYDSLMNNTYEPAILPKKLLGSRIEEFLDSNRYKSADDYFLIKHSLKDFKQGWLINGPNRTENSKLVAAIIYEMRCLDMTATYIDGYDLSYKLQIAAKSFKYDDFELILKGVMPYRVIAIDGVNALDFSSYPVISLMNSLEKNNKIIIASSNVKRPLDPLDNICNVINLK